MRQHIQLQVEEYVPMHSYCFRWKRRDGSDEFRHWVFARSIFEAISRSEEEIVRAIGPNAGLWRIDMPPSVAAAKNESRPMRRVDGPRRPKRRVWLLSVNLLLLIADLLLFHYLTSPHRIH